MSENRLLLANIGEQKLAFPVCEIFDVINTPKMTRVPLSEEYILGILNLRGKVITVICLSRFLGINSNPINKNAIIIHDKNDAYCFCVDFIGEVLDYEDSDFKLLPSTLSDQWGGLIMDVIPEENSMILRINVEELMKRLISA